MHVYKLVVLGNGGVGKSAITVRFAQGFFEKEYRPTIEDAYMKTINLDGTLCKLEILDTAGTEQFRAMRDIYLKNGQGFVLVYDITDDTSFRDIDDVKKHINRVREDQNLPLILVGNKADLESQRVVSKNEGQSLATSYDCGFLEASAKNDTNIAEIFSYVVRAINRLSPGRRPNSKGCIGNCVLL